MIDVYIFSVTLQIKDASGKDEGESQGCSPCQEGQVKENSWRNSKRRKQPEKGKIHHCSEKAGKIGEIFAHGAVQLTSLFQHHQAVFKFRRDVRKEINAKNEVRLLKHPSF